MSTVITNARLLGILVGSCVLMTSEVQAADPPSPKLTFAFRPGQKDVEYDTPPASEFSKCKVSVERTAKTSGWVVTGPAGEVLRRFIDTNGDNVVDQWRYFQRGLEVYRDIDSNFNNKIDQSRWLNTAGTRWGIDSNEDGRIDSWKVISAEETARQAVEALIQGDSTILKSLLIDAADIRTLGLSGEISGKLLKSVADPDKKLRAAIASSKSINAKTKWLRFDSSRPSLIPAGDGKTTKDTTIYENALAIVEANGNAVLVQIGEMVRVGDSWKLTRVPQPLEGDTVRITVSGILMQPPTTAPAAGGTTVASVSPETQKLLEALRDLDGTSPAANADRTSLASFNAKRVDLLAKLVETARTDEERSQWTRQMIDGIASAVQTGSFPAGLTRLKRIESDIAKTSPKSSIRPYVTYRRLLAEYTLDLQQATTERRQELQVQWLKNLEAFATTYPTADDAPDAQLQLAVANEFAGNVTDARKWYDRLISQHTESNAGQRAVGAVRRLDLQGQQFILSGKGLSGRTVSAADYRGKVLLVLYWSTWCKPCTEDLPQIRALYAQYQDLGFEILGVNLDATVDPVAPYMKQHRVTWQQIREEGGLEGKPAKAYGVISLPTMMLVGRDGKAIKSSVSVAELKQSLPEWLKAK
jgi:peroxiredoxin